METEEDKQMRELRKLREELHRSKEKWLNKKYSFLRWLVLTALGFTSIFIAFSDMHNAGFYVVLFHVSTVMLLCLAILLSGIALLGEVKEQELVVKWNNKIFHKFRKRELNLELAQESMPLHYKMAETCAYLCYSLFIISLIFFTIASAM